MILNSIIKSLNVLIDGLGKLGKILVNLLPNSPFLLVQQLDLPYLDTLNWVMPISFMITVLGYWVTAIGLYYAVQTGLRWVKAVQ